MQPRASSDFYRTQQAIALTARNELGRMWDRVGDDFQQGWRRVTPAATVVLAEARLQAAAAAQEYVPNVLAETGVPDRPEGDLIPSTFAVSASDGRRLDTLVAGASAQASVAITDGKSRSVAQKEAGEWVRLMAALQVTDAARVAAGVMGASRKNLGGNVRVLNLPVCQRCAVLGGRFYRWSKGFDRHPGDDCTMMPVPSENYAIAEGFLSDPRELALSGGIKDLTPRQLQAIEDGADVSQVVNATRGMSTTALTTAEGTTRRAVAGKRLGNFAREPGSRYSVSQTPRLTPEAIYQLANGNRAEAITMLRDHGYIT